MQQAYFDHAATTRPHPEVVEAVTRGLNECWGNPSSSYDMGLEASLAVRQAKTDLAALLGVDRDELYCTSGGTEGNNTCLFGAALAQRRRGNQVITSLAEHASVIEAAAQLAKDGFDVINLAPDAYGCVSLADLEQALTPNTILVSLMLINNETGGVHPIADMVKLVRKKAPNAIFHCDLVASLGKTPLNLHRLGVDLATVSAHKIGGPKGCGAIYIKKGVRILPRLFGGTQQAKLRPGTESVPLILGFGQAARLHRQSLAHDIEHAKQLNSLAREALLKGLPQCSVHSGPNASPFILNFSTNQVRSETMLHALDAAGFLVSAGSACGGNAKSHVLSAMPLSPKEIDTALRVSFGAENTPQQTKQLIEQVITLCAQLQKAW